MDASTPILRSLGLLESEIKTYLTALECGASTVVELAKVTGLSRQATYSAIETLTARSLMTSAVYGKKKLFAAERPEKLLAYAHRREAEMREVVRDLERSLPALNLAAGGEKPVVKVYEGKEGILAIMDEIRRAKPKEMFEITDLDAMYAILSQKDLLPLRTELKELGILVKGLYAGTPSQPIVNVDRRMLPAAAAGFKANLAVYGDKIALVTFEGKMVSVIIESKALAATLRILFALAFKTMGKP